MTSDGDILRRMLLSGRSAEDLLAMDRKVAEMREANRKPASERTGRLRNIGVCRLGAFARYVYWQCVDCNTDFPQLPGNAGPSCNGTQISLCPWCRPKRVLP